ncbi:hypothetical protein K0B04_02405 [Patescibacteria group bacterium]|nr:hypothetical protein [Patescibacteria group bacterium]
MNKPLFLSSLIKNPRGTSYEGKDNDEQVILLVRQSLVSVIGWLITGAILFIIPIFLMPFLSVVEINDEKIFNGMFIFAFTLFWYLALFGYVFQSFIHWYFEVLLITNKKIIDIDRGATNISETTLDNVQDVTSKMASVIGQVLNVGSIHIQTAAEREEFEFHLVDNPSIVRDAISDMVAKKGNRKHGL